MVLSMAMLFTCVRGLDIGVCLHRMVVLGGKVMRSLVGTRVVLLVDDQNVVLDAEYRMVDRLFDVVFIASNREQAEQHLAR